MSTLELNIKVDYDMTFGPHAKLVLQELLIVTISQNKPAGEYIFSLRLHTYTVSGKVAHCRFRLTQFEPG